ncbi:MAG: hypothetical protein [Olavius algarvensis Gamma 1 endosymbiont]|nr:MAG: hypothetical protein [Olavius algarvensis Gamma 1 endosymbiont]
MSPERRAKGGLGCPVSHPEHGDTLTGACLPRQAREAYRLHRRKRTRGCRH